MVLPVTVTACGQQREQIWEVKEDEHVRTRHPNSVPM